MSTPAAAIQSPTASRGQNQLARWENLSAQGEIVAADTGTATLIPQTNTKKQLVVRKITINVYTTAAQAFGFESSGSGADPVFNKAASPALGAHQIDFGEVGYALPAGEGLAIALGVTGGNAFTYVVECYKRPIAGAGTPAQMV